MTLALNISTIFQGDITVALTSPQGTTITVLGSVGAGDTFFGCGQDDFDIVLADGGATLPVNIADCWPSPLVGTFAPGGGSPTQPLSTFNGEDPNGTWIIEFTDEDVGAFDPTQGLNSGSLTVVCA